MQPLSAITASICLNENGRYRGYYGCYPELLELLQKIRFDKKADRLILLGDLMDRGAYSKEVLMFAITMQAEMQERFVYIRGSHEYILLRPQKSLLNQLQWNLVGKQASVRSFQKYGESVLDYLEWIASNSRLYFIDRDFQCVHKVFISLAIYNQNLILA